MIDTVENLGAWRTNGKYRIGVAQRLTGVSGGGIKRWLQDYPAHIAELKPPWADGMGPRFDHLTKLSFLELLEVLIAGKIRAGNKGGYREVRKYHDAIAAEWGTQFAFVHQNFLAHKERLPEAAVKVLGQMDYEDGFVSRWCPMGKDGALALDPQRAGGQPAIKGRRLRVVDIKDSFMAGESVNFLADDFDLKPQDVEAALRYALWLSK